MTTSVFPDESEEEALTADNKALLLACSDYSDERELFKIIPGSSLEEEASVTLELDDVASITSESELELDEERWARFSPLSGDEDDVSSIISKSDIEENSESETETPPKKKSRCESAPSVAEEDSELDEENWARFSPISGDEDDFYSIVSKREIDETSESETEMPPKKKGRRDSAFSVSEEGADLEQKNGLLSSINSNMLFFRNSAQKRGAALLDSEERHGNPSL